MDAPAPTGGKTRPGSRWRVLSMIGLPLIQNYWSPVITVEHLAYKVSTVTGAPSMLELLDTEFRSIQATDIFRALWDVLQGGLYPPDNLTAMVYQFRVSRLNDGNTDDTRIYELARRYSGCPA